MRIFSKNTKPKNVEFTPIVNSFCDDTRQRSGDAMNQMLNISEMATDAVQNEDQTKVPSPAAKELLRALRHRLKAANPMILVRGLTLLKVLSDNTPQRFTSVIAQDFKLISIIREIVQKYKGSDQAVHDRALAVFAHLAYRFKDDTEGRVNVTDVYNSEMRPLDAPLDGQIFPEEMLIAGLSSSGSRGSRRAQNPVEQQAALLARYAPRQPGVTDEQIAHEVSVAQSNAQIFSEALSSTPLDQLESSEILQEFLTAVKESQEKILGLIASVPDSPGLPPPDQTPQPAPQQTLMEEPQPEQAGLPQPLQPVQAPAVTRNGKGRATSQDSITPAELNSFEPLESPTFAVDNNPFRDPNLLQQFEAEQAKPKAVATNIAPTASNPVLSTLLSTNEQLHSVIESYNHALEKRDAENAVKSVEALQTKGKFPSGEELDIDDYGMRVGSSRSPSGTHAIV